LLAARGWEWAWTKLRWRAPMFISAVVALAPISANFVYRIVPFPLYEEGYMSQQAADWYRNDAQIEKDFPRIMPTPPQVFYFMDVSQSDANRANGVSKQSVTHPPAGAVLVWDPVYGAHNSSADLCVDQQLIEASGWVHYRHFECYDKYCEVYLSPLTFNGEDSRKKYPPNIDSLFGLPNDVHTNGSP